LYQEIAPDHNDLSDTCEVAWDEPSYFFEELWISSPQAWLVCRQ